MLSTLDISELMTTARERACAYVCQRHMMAGLQVISQSNLSCQVVVMELSSTYSTDASSPGKNTGEITGRRQKKDRGRVSKKSCAFVRKKPLPFKSVWGKLRERKCE